MIKPGDKIKDLRDGAVGTVEKCDDLHNVEVVFNGGGFQGGGLYCLVKDCPDNDLAGVKIIPQNQLTLNLK